MYSYCLFVETGKELLLKAGLQQILPSSTVLVPTCIFHTYKDGRWIDQRQPIFKSYLFVFQNEPLDVSIVLRQRPLGIIKFLRNNNGTYELQGSDKAFSDLVWKTQGHLDAASVIEEEKVFKFADPLFENIDAQIVMVSRRRGTIQVEFRLDGKTSRVWRKYPLQTPAAEKKAKSEAHSPAEPVADTDPVGYTVVDYDELVDTDSP